MYTYGNYGTTYGTTQAAGEAAGGLLAGLGIMMIFFYIIMIAVAVVCLIAKYKMFKKMGIEGWKSLIPMVSDYLQMEATGVNQIWLLVVTCGSAVAAIPVLGWLAFAAAMIYYAILVNVSLAKAFGKSTGFAVGLILLAPVFLIILGFSKDAKFVGKDPMNDIIFKK